jgi:hypothetical protein
LTYAIAVPQRAGGDRAGFVSFVQLPWANNHVSLVGSDPLSPPKKTASLSARSQTTLARSPDAGESALAVEFWKPSWAVPAGSAADASDWHTAENPPVCWQAIPLAAAGPASWANESSARSNPGATTLDRLDADEALGAGTGFGEDVPIPSELSTRKKTMKRPPTRGPIPERPRWRIGGRVLAIRRITRLSD